MSIEEYRLSGLRYPRHILGPDGEPMCGCELGDDHKSVIESASDGDLDTVEEFFETQGPVGFIGSLCGNCRRVLLAKAQDEKYQAAWDSRVEATREGAA